MVEEVEEPGEDDARLLDALRAVAGEADPVPGPVLQAARDSFTWRTIDAELAELSYDSVLDDALLVGIRGEAPRSLTFEAPDMVVEVEVTDAGDRRRLLGRLVPPGGAEIHIRHSGGMVRVDVDDVGRFAAAGVAPGPVSLRCRLEGREPVETPWVIV